RNGLPDFLDRLVEDLDSEKLELKSHEKADDISQDHGLQRSDLDGYSLYQIIREYQYLRESILETIEKDDSISFSERDFILSSIERGMAEASAFYVKFSKIEELAAKLSIEGIKDHAIIRTDLNGLVEEWNSGAEKILGFTKN